MERIKNLTNIIASANNIAKGTVNNEASAKRIEHEKNALTADMENNPYIKVPFVGDFSAGKSSLLNSLMGNQLLPTDVVPTTAVSYELYYSDTERLIVNKGGGVTQEEPTSRIGSLELSPGDIVKVYTNNDFIKSTNSRGIVLVDMPGIDSGIEAHNNAILNYIKEGTFFFLVTPAPQGTLRDTTIRFAEELKKYGLQMAVVISKTDQTESNSLKNIADGITDLAQRYIAPDVKVALSSAAEGDNAGVKAIIDGLDAEKTLYEKFAAETRTFVSGIISELQMQMPLLVADRESFDAKIKDIEKEKQLAIENIRARSESAQPLESSADDILNDVREAIMQKSSHLADVIYNSQNNKDVISAELLNIVRPVLVAAFKRELTEYSEAVGGCVQDFSEAVGSILNDDNNKLLEFADEIYKGLNLDNMLKSFTTKKLESVINKPGNPNSLANIVKYLPALIDLLIQFLPQLIKWIFGSGKDSKVKAIKEKLQTVAIAKIAESLRPQIMRQLKEQRQAATEEMEKAIETETAKYNDSIRAIQGQQQADEASVKAKLQSLYADVERLQALLRQI